MTTKEELIKAWETISQFCEEQTRCDRSKYAKLH